MRKVIFVLFVLMGLISLVGCSSSAPADSGVEAPADGADHGGEAMEEEMAEGEEAMDAEEGMAEGEEAMDAEDAAEASTEAEVIMGDLVTVADKAFTPDAMSVELGKAVTWKNDGDRAVLIQIRDAEDRSQLVRSPRLSAGETFTHTFDAAGDYDVMDVIFGTRGTITVLGGSAE